MPPSNPRATLAIAGRRLLVDAATREPAAPAALPDGTEHVPLGGDGAHTLALVPADAGPFAGVDAIDPMRELGRFARPLRDDIVRALALAAWSDAERCCSRCGAALAWDADGRTKTCTGPRPHQHFPRVDPAVIVLVERDGSVLLGRNRDWPEGRFSTIAGFVEPGEDVEAAVRREVAEETGVTVGAVRYAGSEPWPFPRSLMLGFHATATSETIVVGDELAEAHWFDAAGVRALRERHRADAPHFESIARRLMDEWLERRSG